MSKWPVVKLGEIMAPIARAEPPVPGTVYRQLGVKLWGAGAYERDAIDGSQTKYAKLFRAESGDVIVNKIWARNGSVAVVSPALAGCFGSGEFPMFVPKSDRIDTRWIHWLTKTRYFWEQCDEKSRGTSGKNRIKPEQFLKVEIPLPPLSEQQRIVTRIEELAVKINEAKRLSKQAIEETEGLISAYASTIFATTNNEVTSLESIATLERGKFNHRPRNEPRFFGGDHPWIQIGEIESSNKYIRTWTQTLNDDGLAISKKFPRGTVLISIAATIGSVGILDFDCCIPDSIVAVTPKQYTDSEFIYYYLSYLRWHLEKIAPQSAQKNINLSILTKVSVPKILLPEQHRIVAELDALQAQIDALKLLQAETSAELDTLLPAVLDRAFKGEL